MGLFDRVENRLERAVNGVFAKAFRSEVQAVEIASAIRRAMDDRAAVLGHGRTIVPNMYAVELSHTDYERLTGYSEALTDELIATAQEHAESQRYTPGGPFAVSFDEDDDLETGVFRLRPATARHPEASAPPLRPVVPHHEPASDYERPQPAVHVRSEDEAGYPDSADHRWSQPPANTRGEGGYAAPPAAGYVAGTAAAAGHAAGSAGSAPGGGPAMRQEQGHGQPNRQDGQGEYDQRGQQPQGREQQPTQPHRMPPPPTRVPRPWLDIDGQRYPLLDAITVLGRDNSADIILDDPGISRRHSELRVTSDGPHLVTTLRDLGSTNGTFVEGERIGSRHLSEGETITVGRTRLTFHHGKR